MARRTSEVKLPDISGLSSQELTALVEAAEELLAEKREDEKRALMEEFRMKAAQRGIPFEEITGRQGRRKRSDAGKSVAPKYRGPKGELWSGRGRPPRWVVELEAKGKKRADYAI